MKLKILGSGGGEGFPAVFCRCNNCEKARKLGGKNIRTCSQTLINDELLIDLPMDTIIHSLNNNICFGDFKNVLITHTHLDHFIPTFLRFRGGVYAHNLKHEKVSIFGPSNLESVFYSANMAYGEVPEHIMKNISLTSLQDKTPINIDGYEIIPLKAKHAPTLGSLNYVIIKDKKAVLYLLDSGYPENETLSYLSSLGITFDCVVLDATMGVSPPKAYAYHMGFEENKILKNELISLKLASEDTIFIASHITHNKAGSHEEIEKIFSGTNIIVAYDGFEVEF